MVTLLSDSTLTLIIISISISNYSVFNQAQFDYLIATATLQAEYTRKLHYAWTAQADPDDSSLPGFIDVISKPGLNNPIYSSEQAVMFEFVNGILGILNEVTNGKLSDPLGSDFAHANVEAVESPYPWNSLADFEDNIRSVYNVYTGTYGTHKGFGLKDVIAQQDPVLAAKVEARIIQTMNKIKAILNPQGRALTTEAINDLNDLFLQKTLSGSNMKWLFRVTNVLLAAASVQLLYTAYNKYQNL